MSLKKCGFYFYTKPMTDQPRPANRDLAPSSGKIGERQRAVYKLKGK